MASASQILQLGVSIFSQSEALDKNNQPEGECLCPLAGG